ncbi:MAG: hypothetical protein LBD03_04500 [Methanobrevibacter sp.]|jgi:hypothetical protein|nr:hypothetical protein [Candidatus Methanovirga procula]
MLKLYPETKIVINLNESKIIISRGYWNFIQTSIGFSNVQKKESDKLIDIFNKISLESQIEETQIEEKYKKILNQLVEEKLIYRTDKKFESKNILILSDITNKIKEKFIKYEDNIILYSIKEFNDKFLNNISYEEILQNPLIKKEIQENIKEFIDSKIDIIFLISLKVNNDFFKILNHLFTKKIVYTFFDKDFIYLFGIEKKYTGCYQCFSKNMDARLKNPHEKENVYMIENKETYTEKEYLLDLVLSILEYNITEYLYKDILPIFGRVCTIFTSTLEIRYENIL